jgi:anti-anti-sigma regulatory factor
MVKITESKNGAGMALHVEGVLRAAEADELVRACEARAGMEKNLELDLKGVTFCDESGLRALRGLLGLGVRIGTCSPLVAGLLEEVER